LKRTKETLSPVKEEEKWQGLSWSEICRKQTGEQAKEERRQKLARQEFFET
jgi:hypothetical protein